MGSDNLVSFGLGADRCRYGEAALYAVSPVVLT